VVCSRPHLKKKKLGRPKKGTQKNKGKTSRRKKELCKPAGKVTGLASMSVLVMRDEKRRMVGETFNSEEKEGTFSAPSRKKKPKPPLFKPEKKKGQQSNFENIILPPVAPGGKV